MLSNSFSENDLHRTSAIGPAKRRSGDLTRVWPDSRTLRGSYLGTLIKRHLWDDRGKAYLKSDFASEACTPLVASTACVTCRSTASEHSI